MTVCRLCEGQLTPSFKHKILEKYEIQYFSCPSCGLFQTETPYWLEEAYTQVINSEDIGIFKRNYFLSGFLLAWLIFKKARNAIYLDFSGGYGILVRLMRDYGFNFLWTDKYCENIFAKNAIAPSANKNYQLVTSFEVIEHVERPREFIQHIFSLGTETFLFSTQLFKNSTPPQDWWYLGFNHGQHISFFNPKSLKKLASLENLHLVSFRNMHLLSKKKHNKLFFIFCYVISFFGLTQFLANLVRPKSLD
jgi:hypothetical protein